MRLSVVLLIVLASVTVLQASPYGKRAKDRLGAWKPKALREKEAAERAAQEKAAAEAEAKALEEARKAAEVPAVDEVKAVEQPKAEEQPSAPVASEDTSAGTRPEQDAENPSSTDGEPVLETSVVGADSPLVDTVVTTDVTETATELIADPANNVPEFSPVVEDQREALAIPVAEETPIPT